MTSDPQTWSVHGFVNPVGMVPTFVIPLLTVPRSNYLFVQQIDADDRIASFQPIDLGSHDLVQVSSDQVVRVGARALWGFQTAIDSWHISDRDGLRSVVEQVDLSNLPLLELQCARFLGLDPLPAIARSYAFLCDHSERTAGVWRNLAIVAPQVQAELARLLPARSPLTADLQSLFVTSDQDRLSVHLSPRLMRAIGGESDWRAHREALAPLFEALRVRDVSLVERDPDPAPQSAAMTRSRVKLVATEGTALNIAAVAAKLAHIDLLRVEDLLDRNGRLVRHVPLDKQTLVLLVAEDNERSLALADRLAKRLVGRHAQVGAIVLRSAGSGTHRPRSANPELLEKRFEALARSAHWLTVIGGGSLSASLIMKWLPRAIAEAAARQEGGPLLDLLFRIRRTPKLAVVGSASATGFAAGASAAAAAFGSLAAGAMKLAEIQALAVFVFRGANSSSDSLDQVREIVTDRTPEAEIGAMEVIRPGLKAEVRVLLIARGLLGVDETWRGSKHLREFEANGWLYGHHLPEVDVLDVYIHKGGAQYVLRSELERPVDTRADADRIIASTPMYRGPVVLLLAEQPTEDIRRYLMTAGIVSVAKGHVEDLDVYGDLPIGAMRDELLLLPRDEACRRLRYFIRDLVWAELSSEDAVHANAGWLYESYPEHVVIERTDLYRISSDKTLFFRGHASAIRPDEQQDQRAAVRFAFWLTLDDRGARVTRIEPA